jgi:hypothetical protein
MIFEINWPKSYFTVFFIVFGFFSVFSGKLNLITTIFSIIVLSIFFYIDKKKLLKNSRFKIDKSSLIIFPILILIMLALSFDDLQGSLYCDELSTALRSLRWPYYTSKKFLDFFDFIFLKSLPFRYIVQFFAFIFLCLLLFLIYKIYKNLNYKILFLCLSILLLFRTYAQDSSPNMPLSHIPILIFSSLFGITDLSIRLSYFFSTIVLIVCIYNLLINLVGKINSFFFSLFIITIPIIIKISNFVEFTIWSALIMTFGLLYFEVKNTFSLKKLLGIFIIGSLFRFNIIFGLILVLKSFFSKKIKINFIYCSLFILPVLLISFNFFFLKHPALDNFSKEKVILNTILGFQNLVFYKNILNDLPIYSFFFFIISFFSRKNFLFFLILFILLNLIYLNIDSDLVSHSKYTSEYLLPFVILGVLRFFFIAKYLFKNNYNIIFPIFLIMLIIINLNNFNIIHNINIDYKKIINKNLDYKYDKFHINLIKPNFPVRKVFQEIEKNNIKNNSLLIGCFYGNFAELLHNYNYYELVTVDKLNNAFLKNRVPVSDILLNNDYGIKNIFIFNSKLNFIFENDSMWFLYKKLKDKDTNGIVLYYKKKN